MKKDVDEIIVSVVYTCVFLLLVVTLFLIF